MSIRNNRLRLYLSLRNAPEMEFSSEKCRAEFEDIKVNSTFPPASLVVRFADNWARLMEKEMLLRSCDTLDHETIKKCELLAGCLTKSERNSVFWAKGLLEDFWKYALILEGYK